MHNELIMSMNEKTEYDHRKRPPKAEKLLQVIDIQSKYIIEWE